MERRNRVGSGLFGVATGMKRLSLDPTHTAKSSAVREYLELVISGWFEMKIVSIYNVNVK